MTPPRSTDDATDPAVGQLTATAYHEAGHAVMALSLGRPIQKVTILPGRSQWGDARLGFCEIKKGRTKASKNLLEDEVLILLAGIVAEAGVTGRYCAEGATEDLRAVDRLLKGRESSVSQIQRVHRRLLGKTEHLLGDDGNWRAVQLIADELIQKRTLSGRAVRHFFQQAIKDAS